MLSNNGFSCTVCVTIFSNGSIIPPGFKFTELHALTLAARSYALLAAHIQYIQEKVLLIMLESLTTGCSGSDVNWIGHSDISTTASGSFQKFLCEELKCFTTGISHR